MIKIFCGEKKISVGSPISKEEKLTATPSGGSAHL